MTSRAAVAAHALRRGLTAVVRGVRRRAHRSDVSVVAGALTFFALLGAVPLLTFGVRVASGLVGQGEVQTTGRLLASYLPGPFGVDKAVVTFTRSAPRLGWWTTIVAVVPISLYSEGIVRGLDLFTPGRARARTLRGRLLTLPLLVLVIMAVVLAVALFRPLLDDPFGTGLGPRLLGIFVAFCILWVGATGVLSLVYRFFPAGGLRPGALVLGAAAAGSWLAGQTLGFVLVLRLVGDVGGAYGGSLAAGTVASLAFLAYLNHLVFLFGYALALTLDEVLPERRAAAGTAERPPAGRPRAASLR